MLPGGKRGEIATGFANAIFDDRATIPIREVGKHLTEGPRGPWVGMSVCCDRLFEVPAFVSIGSSLFSLREIQQEFSGSRCLSHQFLLLRLSSSL